MTYLRPRNRFPAKGTGTQTAMASIGFMRWMDADQKG
jgi:hypothetical protein